MLKRLALATALTFASQPLMPGPAVAAAAAATSVEDLNRWAKTATTHLAIALMRSVADVTFESTEISPGSGGVVITGLLVRAPDFSGNPRGCEVRTDRAEIAFDLLSLAGIGNTLVTARGVTITSSCLPPQGRVVTAVSGLDPLRIDEMTVNSNYDLPSGRLDYLVRLDTPELADIAVEGRLDYVGFRTGRPLPGPEGRREPLPSIKFGPTTLSIVDDGGISRIGLLLGGPKGAGEQAARFVRQRLRLPDLAEDTQAEVERFVADGGRLTVSIAPEDDAWLDRLALMSPARVARTLSPKIGEGTSPTIVPRALLEGLAAGDLSPAQTVEAANAFLTGEGLPRNPARAIALLQPLAADGSDAAARVALARAYLEQGVSLEDAHRLAIDAGTAGGSVRRLLDRLEERLKPQTVIAQQQAAYDAWRSKADAAQTIEGLVGAGDPYTITQAARAFSTGEGRPRHMRSALTLALLGETAGELGAGNLVRELERRMADEAFAADRRAARDGASDLWIGELALKLQPERQ